MNVTVHQNGYLCLVVEDDINHVMIILVKTMERVNLRETTTFVIAFQVSY